MGRHDEECFTKIKVRMENLEKITQYLDGSLSEAEKADFETEMKRNADFEEEVFTVKLAYDAIRSAGTRNVIEEVQKSFLEERKPIGKQVFFGRQVLKYAAGVLLVFAFWGAFQMSKINSGTLLTDYGVRYIEPVMRSTEKEQAEFKLKYQNEDFEGILEALPAIHQPTAEQYFLSSMAAYELKRYALAQQYLGNAQILDLEDSYVNEIPYYQGMIALGLKKYTQAYELLSEVKNNPQNPYSIAVSKSLMIKLRYILLFRAK